MYGKDKYKNRYKSEFHIRGKHYIKKRDDQKGKFKNGNKCLKERGKSQVNVWERKGEKNYGDF